MHSHIRRLTCSVLGAILLLALTLGGSPALAQKRMTMGQTGTPNTFNPWNFNIHHFGYLPNVYDRLAYLDEGLNLRMQLATSIERSADGKVYTVKFRPGARMTSGKEITSQLLAGNIEVLKTGKTNKVMHAKALTALLADVRTPGTHTIQYVFKGPQPAFGDFLDHMFILDPDDFDTIDQKPSGSGPWKMEEFDPGVSVLFVPNKDHWGKVPDFEMEYRAIPDPQTMIISLESGTLDSIYRFSQREVDRLRDKGFNVVAVNKAGSNFAVLYNNDWGPLKDARVRRALGMLVNRNRFQRIGMEGLGEVRCIPYPKASFAWDEEQATRCKFDPEAAKKLLAEAGYPNGFEVEINSSAQANAMFPLLASMLQDSYAQVGVKASIADRDVAGYRATMISSQFQVHVHNYGRAAKDPSALFSAAVPWRYNKSNWTQFQNDEYKRLIIAGETELDQAKRKRIYMDIMDLVEREQHLTVVQTQPLFFASRKGISGVEGSPDGFFSFRSATVD